MKKAYLLILIPLISITMSGCSDSKWDRSYPDMPEDIKTRHEEQLEEHLKILEEESGNVDSLFEVALRHERLGDYESAEEYYKEVLEIDPKHFPALNNIAYIYEQVEEYKLAAEYIKKLYENNPGNSAVLSDTVRMLLEADEPAGAQAALENFVRLKKEAEDTSFQTLISNLYESIFSYNQNHEK